MFGVMNDICGCIKGGPFNMAERHKDYYRRAMLKKYGKSHCKAN
jgi:hypothetical protein